jgi:hypothetical protein
MRIDDAPPAGWYPDPEGGARLRFWEGTDWSDRWRAPPTAGVVEIQARAAKAAREQFDDVGGHVNVGSLNRQDSEAIINQVRVAARAEAERAAGMFRQEARTAAQNLTPLISEYTSKVIRWIRILSVIAVLLLVGWIAFQIFAQISLFEWIGDRIDNLTDDTGMVVNSVVGAVGSIAGVVTPAQSIP